MRELADKNIRSEQQVIVAAKRLQCIGPVTLGFAPSPPAQLGTTAWPLTADHGKNDWVRIAGAVCPASPIATYIKRVPHARQCCCASPRGTRSTCLADEKMRELADKSICAQSKVIVAAK